MKCDRCKCEMEPGQALTSTPQGIRDFPNDTFPITMYAGGPGKLISCEKCPECGKSVTA